MNVGSIPITRSTLIPLDCVGCLGGFNSTSAAGPSSQSVRGIALEAALGTPFYLNLLPVYLTNDTVPLLYGRNELHQHLYSRSRFVPAK